MKKCLLLLGLILSVLTWGIVSAQDVYKLGVVPQFKAKVIAKKWKPIISELESKYDIKLQLIGSPSIPEFEKRLKAGMFDFAYMNPYHMIVANEIQGYTPLIRDHGRALKGILVVKKASGINDVKELDGKVLAFPSPNALGASLLMRAELMETKNIQFSTKYVKTHAAVYRNVSFGGVAAGGGVKRTFNAQDKKLKNDLKVLYETQPVAPHPFGAHPRVAKNIQDKIKQALLTMGQTEHGKKLLANVPIKKIGIATMDDYSPLLELGLKKYAK